MLFIAHQLPKALKVDQCRSRARRGGRETLRSHSGRRNRRAPRKDRKKLKLEAHCSSREHLERWISRRKSWPSQQRPPSPLPRAVLYVLLALLAILLLWSLIGKLDIVATAQGKLVPQTYVKIVQPADAGHYQAKSWSRKAIAYVRAKCCCALIQRLSEADTAIVAKEVELRTLQLRRIDAEYVIRQCRDMSTGCSAGESVEQLRFREVEAQGRDDKPCLSEMRLRTEEAGLEQAEQDLRGRAGAGPSSSEKLLPIFEERKTRWPSSPTGIGAEVPICEKQRAHRDGTEFASQRRTVTSLAVTHCRINRRSRRHFGIPAAIADRAGRDTGGTRKGAAGAREAAASRQIDELRAPQDGVIKDVATYTVGAVVAPAPC